MSALLEALIAEGFDTRLKMNFYAVSCKLSLREECSQVEKEEIKKGLLECNPFLYRVGESNPSFIRERDAS